jgi:hypothetical protein
MISDRGTVTRLILATVTVTLPTACNDDPSERTTTVFSEVAHASGIDFVHHSGAAGAFLMPEIMGGGAGFVDIDGDGYLDIHLVDSDGPNRLYRNSGDATFVEVTDTAGVGDTGYGMGCAAGDYDNDGDNDLYVTNLGANVLYRNNGNGTFTDVTHTAGVGDRSWSTSAAFLDYDTDGDLDLFVTNYVDWSDNPPVHPQAVLHARWRPRLLLAAGLRRADCRHAVPQQRRRDVRGRDCRGRDPGQGGNGPRCRVRRPQRRRPY